MKLVPSWVAPFWSIVVHGGIKPLSPSRRMCTDSGMVRSGIARPPNKWNTIDSS